MHRILVIGPCCAGKSTLAITLAKRLGLPAFHMDKFNWQPGWVESSKDEIANRLNAIITQEAWVIDGTYGGTLPQRVARADMIIYLKFPISLCVWRLMRRIFIFRGTTRPDMTEGCPERFDLGFLFYVMRWNFGAKQRLEAAIAPFKGQLIVHRSPAELQRWLDTLPLGDKVTPLP